jgi:hypothetical protein
VISIRAWLLGIGASLIAIFPLHAEHPEAHPVRIGREGPVLDACVAIGRVSGLNPDGSEHLAVRIAPHEAAHEKSQLALATLVWLCDKEGEWQGIVYPEGAYQDLGDCRVSSPIAEPRPYDGPCQHGWVLAKHLDLVAG